MNVRALRRVFLPVGMAAIICTSVFALTGASSAASRPEALRPDVVGTLRVKVGVMNSKTGKAIRHGTAVAKIVKLGSTAAEKTGAAAPDAVAGPSSICLLYLHFAAKAAPGDFDYVEFTFGSSPFIVGSMFNQTTGYEYAEEAEYQAGTTVIVTVLNNGGGEEDLSGYYGVDYWGDGC